MATRPCGIRIGSGGFTYEDLGNVPASWQIAGTGAFNGANEASILWRNDQWQHGLVESQRLGRLHG